MDPPFPNPTDKSMGESLKPSASPSSSPGFLKGRGRWVIVILVLIFLAVLVVLPPKPKGHRPVFQVAVRGKSAITPGMIARWIGPDPLSVMGSTQAIGQWVSRHPWISRAALLRHPWGGGTVVVTLETPVAVLRPPTVLVPGQTSFPWRAPEILPYLLKTGKIATGRAERDAKDWPQVILRSPLSSEAGGAIRNALAYEKGCRNEGAPRGKLFVYRSLHEIRMLPDHASYYLVLPDRPECAPYRMLRKFLRRNRPDAGGKLSVGLGGEVLGIDLRFSRMLLLRQPLPEKPLSGKHPLHKKL